MQDKMSRRGDGSLFIGRLSKNTQPRHLEDVFEPYGRLTRCDVKYGNFLYVLNVFFWLILKRYSSKPKMYRPFCFWNSCLTLFVNCSKYLEFSIVDHDKIIILLEITWIYVILVHFITGMISFDFSFFCRCRDG